MPATLAPCWTRGKHAVVLGHRGARHAAPENSMAAFQLALDEGAPGVELDVRLNASGEVMVCHDATLERVTEGRDRRALRDLSSAQCHEVRLAQGERLPWLSEVLSWAETRGACVNVEIKIDGLRDARLVPAVAALLGRRRDVENLLVSSFDARALCAFRLLAPRVPSAFLIESVRYVDWPLLERLGASAIHPKHTLVTPARLARWQRAGRRVNVWTVNDPARARELSAWGVDSLISDNPGLLLRALTAGVDVANAQAGGG